MRARTASLLLLLAFVACMPPATAAGAEPSTAADLAADPAFWSALAAAPVGTAISAEADAVTAARLRGAGFVPNDDEPGLFVRAVDLGAVPALAPTGVVELPGIDAIAIVSIDRGDATPIYLYQTLRSLFAELPPGIVVNVVVGDARTDYVAPARLAAELGAQAAQVHVISATPEQADFLAGHFGVHARATWNHGRAMRAYHGTRSLLFLEDDVIFARGMAAVLDGWLARPAPPALSLYNYFCRHLPGAAEDPLRTLDLVQFPMTVLPWEFSRTQAMVYSAEIAGRLGATLSSRLEQAPADALVDHFLRAHDLALGFAQPSMVQHIGRTTTGLGKFHQSWCYADIYPEG